MEQKELDRALTVPGLYVLGNADCPSVTMPVVVTQAYKMFALTRNYELSAVATAYDKGISIASGPHSVQQAQLRQRLDDQRDGELEFWKDLMMRSLGAVRAMGIHAKMIGDNGTAAEMADIQQRIEDVQAADRAAVATITTP